jgi:hypothetical protein
LPQPLGPISATTSARSIASRAPETISRPPRRRVRSSTGRDRHDEQAERHAAAEQAAAGQQQQQQHARPRSPELHGERRGSTVPGHLGREDARRFLDTIAGVAGLVSLGNPPDLFERWLRAVRDDARPVHVVAWVAEEPARPGELAHMRRAREQERLSVLKQRLAWLTPRVWITDPLTPSTNLGVTATSLPGAGAARRT